MLQIGHAVRCPASKFITHTLSHVCFLILLTLATFRLEGQTRTMSTNVTATSDVFSSPIYFDEQVRREKIESLLMESFRPVNKLITEIQICLVFWVLGQCFCCAPIFFCRLPPYASVLRVSTVTYT